MIKNKNNISVYPVILCGGSGKRLWPISRESIPKQFYDFFGKGSSFQSSVSRSLSIKFKGINLKTPLVITNKEYKFLAQDQAKNICNSDLDYILEPESKNTAPSLTLAALNCYQNDKDSVMVVSSSDHFLPNINNFVSTIEKAIKIAKSNGIVLVGVKPTNPSSEFGYIECNKDLKNKSALQVINFYEKPSPNSAKSFLSKGNFLWNAGIFVVKAQVWLEAIELFDTKLYRLCKKSFEDREYSANFISPSPIFFKKIKNDSIDYAVLQKCKNTKFSLSAVELKSRWHDLGTWNSFWQLFKNSFSSNLIFGDVIATKISNSIIYSTSRLVVANNLDDIILIETPDAIMIRKKSCLESQGEIIELLKKAKRFERKLNRKEFRPWGWFDVLDSSNGYKVKKILINPNSSLSLQKHNKRSEHWVVIKGEVNVICGLKRLRLKENESFFVPKNMKHRLFNKSSDPVEIIEVQTGEYLEEDDIIRFEDNYHRPLKGES
jgi:mannose-1-phosphate guanylyltransferase/mannose-6-phosphate isomerase